MTDTPETIYLTEIDYEDDTYPLVWASITADSGGDPYRRADLPRPEDVARIAELEAALALLDKASTDVARYGAQTGPQWTRLTIASLKARAALKEPRHD